MKPQFALRAPGAVLALGTLGLAGPTAAVASSAPVRTAVGASAEDATAPSAAASRRRPAVAVADRDLNVSAGRRAWVRGTLRVAGGTGTVRLQRRAPGGRWRTIARDRTDVRGRYRLRYRTRRAGSHVVRVRFSGDARHRPAARRLGRLNAYRQASASWYGPGLFGHRTACGQTMTASIRGVAHRSLPCGTRLTLRRSTRTVRVRVIDRGPFVAGREFDLSPAVKRALGFGSTGTVGATR